MSAASVAGGQLIQTQSAPAQGGFNPLDHQTALWVGVWMLIGLAGLFGIGLLFRKHIEI